MSYWLDLAYWIATRLCYLGIGFETGAWWLRRKQQKLYDRMGDEALAIYRERWRGH